MKVFTITGKARHGKDTIAEMMKDILEERGYRVLLTHYADLLKYICKTFFNWNGEKDEAGRTILQKVGTETVRTQKPDFWVDFIIDILNLFPYEWDVVIIPDTRFPNEIERLNEEGFDTEFVRVFRPNFDNGLTEEQKNHKSEIALDNYEADVEITNEGTLDELRKDIGNWLSSEMFIGD
jgi:molybdopterin-guanine dinucleotide biosynthesis protein